jgi:hypothetical protein
VQAFNQYVLSSIWKSIKVEVQKDIYSERLNLEMISSFGRISPLDRRSARLSSIEEFHLDISTGKSTDKILKPLQGVKGLKRLRFNQYQTSTSKPVLLKTFEAVISNNLNTLKEVSLGITFFEFRLSDSFLQRLSTMNLETFSFNLSLTQFTKESILL